LLRTERSWVSPPAPMAQPSDLVSSPISPNLRDSDEDSTSSTTTISQSEATVTTVDLRVVGMGASLGALPLGVSINELQKPVDRAFADAHQWLQRFWFAPDGGLPIIRVDDGSPAHAAGLRICDVVIAVNQRDVRDKTAKSVGKRIRKALDSQSGLFLTCIRCDPLPYDPTTLAVLGSTNLGTAGQYFGVNLHINWDPNHRGEGGYGFTPLKFAAADLRREKKKSEALRELKKRCPHGLAGGLPIQDVDPTGPAARSGLAPWDVIVEVNGTNVRDWNAVQIVDAMRFLPPLNKTDISPLQIKVVRSSDNQQRTYRKSSKVTKAMGGVSRAIARMHLGRASKEESFGARADAHDDGSVVTADVVGIETCRSPTR